MKIILASSSKYRQQQLKQLGIEFTAVDPDIDETKLPEESVAQLPIRLARQKAKKVFTQRTDAIVIGSDQVCTFGQQIFVKPGTRDKAIRQLQLFSGNHIKFLTAVCVLTPDGRQWYHLDQTQVVFRTLSLAEIKRYIDSEQPFDCAGSCKVESLGLSLFKAVHSNDPSALMGLPLIKLCELLRHAGIKLP